MGILKFFIWANLKIKKEILGKVHLCKTYKKSSSEFEKLHIFYRISDAGYNKIKPHYIGNENCLKNAVHCFPLNDNVWHIIADNCCEQSIEMVKKYIPESCIEKVSVGHGAGTFRMSFNQAIKLPDNTPVYFLENDYLHRENSKQILLEGLELAPFVTLYDHPDKYQPKHFKVKKGGEKTRVLLSASVHWKRTHSTTMSFAALSEDLKKNKAVFYRWTSTKHPYDCEIFENLKLKGHFLISPLPSYATHGECKFLAPLTNWENEIII